MRAVGELKTKETKETPEGKKRRKAKENKILSQLNLDDNPFKANKNYLGDMIATEQSDDQPTTKPKPPPGKARAPRLVRRSARTLDTDAYAVALKM